GEQHVQGQRRLHVLVQLVVTDLDGPAGRVGVGRRDERLGALDHLGAEELVGDDRGAVVGRHLDRGRTVARTVVVLDREVVLDLLDAEPAAQAQGTEQDQRHEHGKERPAAPLGWAPAAGRPAPGCAPVPTTVVVVLELEVELVDHLVRLRWVLSQLCRISTAAAWSTTVRWRFPRTPRSVSLREASAVDILSSDNRTGTGAMARARACVYSRS